MPINPNIIAGLQTQQQTLDLMGAINDVSLIQARSAAARHAQRQQQAQDAFRSAVQQHQGDYDAALDQLDSLGYGDIAIGLRDDLQKLRKGKAEELKAQMEAVGSKLSIGAQVANAMKANPAAYAVGAPFLRSLDPSLADYLGDKYDPVSTPQHLDTLVQMGNKLSELTAARRQALDEVTKLWDMKREGPEYLTKGTKALATWLATARDANEYDAAIKGASEFGLDRRIISQFAPTFSPEAVQKAQALAAKTDEKESGSPESQYLATLEKELGRPLTSAEREQARKKWGQADDRPITINTGQRPMTQTAEASLITRLSGQWDKATKSQKEINRQVTIMDRGLAAGRRGDLPQANEAVLQTFLKILDPESVVREGEFARLREGASMLTRVEAAVQRLTAGGFLPMSELEKYAALAREVQGATRKVIGPVKERIGKTADRYKIPRDLVMDESVDVGAGAAPANVEVWQWEKGPDGKPRRKK